MGNVVIKGIQEPVFVATPNYYKASLKLSVLDYESNEYIVEDVPMTEISEPVTDFTAKTDGAFVTDDKIIKLTTVDGLRVSDRLSIGNEVYRVTKISGNDVSLHVGLMEDIADQADVTRVGNLGIYKMDLFVTREGVFILQARDTKFGLQKSDSLTVKDRSLEDLFEFTNVNIDENERIIKETSSWSIII
jgi:hypothetical protein